MSPSNPISSLLLLPSLSFSPPTPPPPPLPPTSPHTHTLYIVVMTDFRNYVVRERESVCVCVCVCVSVCSHAQACMYFTCGFRWNLVLNTFFRDSLCVSVSVPVCVCVCVCVCVYINMLILRERERERCICMNL